MKKRSPSKRGSQPRSTDRPATPELQSHSAQPLLTGARIDRLPDVLRGGASALLVVTPLIPSEATTEGIQTPLNMLWLLLLLGWGVGLLLKRNQTFRFGWTDAALAGLIGWHIISCLVMGPQGHGRQTLNVGWQWITYGVLFLLLRQLAVTPQQQRAIAAVMIGVAVALAVHGLYQYFYSGELMRQAYLRNPDQVLQENAWPIDRATPIRTLIENRVLSKEPLATFALTNSLAGYLGPWLIFVGGLGLLALSKTRYRLLAATCGIALVLGACLFLTKSRTAILASAASTVLLLLYGPRRGWRLDWKVPTAIAAVAVVVGLGAVLVGGLDLEVLSEAPLSVRYRLEYWRATAAMIADYPLFGCGPGNYQEYYSHYKLPQASETIKDPHNFILEIWATAGTPALLFLFGLAAGFIYDLRSAEQAFRSSEPAAPQSGLRADEAPIASQASPRIDTKLWWVFGGAAAGVVLAIPLAWIAGYPLEPSLLRLPLAFGPPVPLVLGLPAGAFAVWLLRGWIAGGELPVSISVIALLCLLINLLAAGAVAFPGVVNTAWVLLMLGLASAGSSKNKPISPAWAAAAMVPITILLAAYIFTQYRPVLNSQTYMSTGDALHQAGNLPAAEHMYVQAAEADPWASEPWRKLLDLRLQTWYESRTPQNWRRYEAVADRFLTTDPQFYGLYESVAISNMSAAGVEPTPERRNRVVELLQRAVELYPNGALLRAQLAWALHRADRPAEAAEQATEALRLDSLHHHSEQKLKAIHLYDPSQPDVDPEGLRPENAEQSMKNLRNASGRLRQ